MLIQLTASADAEQMAKADAPKLPKGDYVSPSLDIVLLDAAFPNMVVATTASNQWPYLRREISHNWYVDRRNPTVGFLSRDEAVILYNLARRFVGLPCLEIGCWRGWSSAHIALGAGNLEIVDPILSDPEFRQDVAESLRRAGVLDRVVMHDGASPAEVDRLCAGTGKRWSFAFIDGDHEGAAPRLDVETVHRYMSQDAMIVLHDLASPHVAAALTWLRVHGWTTYIYQTMQIMGVAVRGSAKPSEHVPDPSQRWSLPSHLASFAVIGETRTARLHRTVAALEGHPPSSHGETAIDSLAPSEATALDLLLTQAADRFEQQDTIVREFDDLQKRYLALLDRLTELQAQPSLQKEFDDLQKRYLALLDRLSELQAQPSLQQAQPSLQKEFDGLQRQHLALLERVGDAEFVRDRALGELDEARRATAEHEGTARLLDSLQSKHLDLLRSAAEREADQAALLTRLEATEKAAAERDELSLMFERLQRKHFELLARLNEIQAVRDRSGQEVEAAKSAAQEAAAQVQAEAADSRDVALASRDFAHWIARKRILFGLTRRLLLGRREEVRRTIERVLRERGVPEHLVPDVMWIARPRAIFSLARRRALTDMRSVEGHVLLSLEHLFGVPFAVGATSATAELKRLRDTVNGVRAELEQTQHRFASLEAAKLADEEALLEADLTIARLRGTLASTQP